VCALAFVLLLVGAPTASTQPVTDQDRIDLTGQQNLTLGAGTPPG